MAKRTVAELEKLLAEQERYISQLEESLGEERAARLDDLAALRDKSRLVDAYEMILTNTHDH